MVILPSTDPAGGANFVERVRRKVEDHDFILDGDVHVKLTLSAGTASTPHAEIPDPIALVRCADEALYAAKRTGRNRCVRYDQIQPASSGASE